MTSMGIMLPASSLKPGLAFMENWGEMYISPQSVQNLEILITSSILGVECSDFVRILDIIFLKFELNFEMLTWIFPNLKTSKSKTRFGCQDLPYFVKFMIIQEKLIPHVFSCQGHILTPRIGTPRSRFPLFAPHKNP